MSYISQIVMTIGGGSVTPASGLITELENVESRLETYPMLRAFLKLIGKLEIVPPLDYDHGIY